MPAGNSPLSDPRAHLLGQEATKITKDMPDEDKACPLLQAVPQVDPLTGKISGMSYGGCLKHGCMFYLKEAEACTFVVIGRANLKPKIDT